MKIKVTEQNGQTTIVLNGMLDSSSAPSFQEVVDKQLAKKNIDILVDMTDLAYTSSQGLRIILTLIKTVLAKSGKLVFQNIRPAVKEILDMAGISQAMNIKD